MLIAVFLVQNNGGVEKIRSKIHPGTEILRFLVQKIMPILWPHAHIIGHTKILNISAPEWIFDLIFSTPPGPGPLFWMRKTAININFTLQY